MVTKDKVFVTSPSMPSYDEYIQMIKKIWINKMMTNGGELHNELERKLSDYLGVDSLALTSNGHSALEIALQSMELKGEVITTPFTFVSTTHAVVRSGLKPIFCDIKKSDYTIDENLIENLVTENTCAILPVHVFGNVCDVESIERIARKYSLKVIYDAAHSFGERIYGSSVLNFGDASAISFHATKVFNTVEGGAICTRDENLYNIMVQYRNFGIQDAENVSHIGTNAKMSEFHAAMGLCNLRHYEHERKKRKKIAEIYLECLDGIRGIKIPCYKEEITYNYAYFPIVIDKSIYGYSRDDVFEWLSKENVFCRKYFYPLTNSLECYGKDLSEQTPIAKEIANSILCLPLYADLDENSVMCICEVIRKRK